MDNKEALKAANEFLLFDSKVGVVFGEGWMERASNLFPFSTDVTESPYRIAARIIKEELEEKEKLIFSIMEVLEQVVDYFEATCEETPPLENDIQRILNQK